MAGKLVFSVLKKTELFWQCFASIFEVVFQSREGRFITIASKLDVIDIRECFIAYIIGSGTYFSINFPQPSLYVVQELVARKFVMQLRSC